MATQVNTFESSDSLSQHRVVSGEQWLNARKELLKREKELTKLKDELAAARRALPWEMAKNYSFDGPDGKVTLADLFQGKNQLIVYHFMFGPEWTEGCPSCSFVSDHMDGMLPHLAARDVAYAAVSRASSEQIEAFKRRMGWQFPWVSSQNNDFNWDYHVSFTKDEVARGMMNYNYKEQNFPSDEGPGFSVFYKDAEGKLFHTYSAFGRGAEVGLATYQLLDLVPKGRDEDKLPYTMAWVRHHDRYENAPKKQLDSCCAGHEQP